MKPERDAPDVTSAEPHTVPEEASGICSEAEERAGERGERLPVPRFDFQIQLVLGNKDFFIQPGYPEVREIAAMVNHDDIETLSVNLIDELTDRAKYILDPEAWGKREFWQAPIETIQLGHGDCADLTYLASSVLHVLRKPHRIVYGFLTEEGATEKQRLSADQGDVGHAWLEIIDDSERIYLLEFTRPYLFILDGKADDPYKGTWYLPYSYLEFYP